jgi:hypothetical protein
MCAEDREDVDSLKALFTLPLEADEVSWLSWQLITAICDEGDGLILCEWLSEG